MEEKTEPEQNAGRTNWEELKYRMQGAFQVLTGQSAAVDFQRWRDMQLSHSIMEDDLAYSRMRSRQKAFEDLLPENHTPEEAEQMAKKIRDFINEYGTEIAEESRGEIDLER